MSKNSPILQTENTPSDLIENDKSLMRKELSSEEQDSVVYIGERCREARTVLKLDRDDIARECGVTYQQIFNFEKAGKGSLQLLKKYCAILHREGFVNPAWIILEDNKNIPFKTTDAIKHLSKQMDDLVTKHTKTAERLRKD